MTEKERTAILAGGCFWGMEELLRKVPGVISTVVGYTGGNLEGPLYEDVKTGATGHVEAVKIVFDEAVLPYRALLEFFFNIHDPTTPNRQGGDIGSQYRSVIFYTDEDQHNVAVEVKKDVNRSGKWKVPVVTQIMPAKKFWDAEEYHQKYLIKHPNGYTCHFIRR
ncbi:MAG: peptide-methionine (S)-S-oxide reductase MsrA [Pseudomonadota bacterium]